MGSKICMGNGQVAPAVIVEKQVPMPLSIQYNKDSNNKLTEPTTVINLNGITDISGSILTYAYFANDSITSADLSSLIQITGNKKYSSWNYMGCCYYTFAYCKNLTDVDLSNVTTISGENTCYGMFYGCTSLTNVNLSSLTTIGYNSCQYMFQDCSSLVSMDLSSLTTVTGPNSAMFGSCTKLETLDLSGLTTVSGERGLQTFVSRCSKLTTVKLDSLTTITGNKGCSQMFYDCGIKNVSFPVLSNINGNSIFSQAFELSSNVNVYFPALTSNSFGNYTNQFDNIFKNVNGNTIHFPSSLEAKIQTLTGYPNFGGTNTILAFDLPATE